MKRHWTPIVGCMSAFVGAQKQAGIAIGEFRLVMVV